MGYIIYLTSENIASNLWMFISLKIGLDHDPFEPVSIDQFYLLNNNIPTRNVYEATWPNDSYILSC